LGQTEKGPRKEIFYFDDDGGLNALRYNNWKIHFKIQEHHGIDVWKKPYTELRMPLIMNLRSDPFEKAHIESFLYDEWTMNHLYLLLPAQDIVGEFLMTFKDYPQRQPIGSFSLDKVMKTINEAKRN